MTQAFTFLQSAEQDVEEIVDYIYLVIAPKREPRFEWRFNMSASCSLNYLKLAAPAPFVIQR